jgi:hypothetical protein
VPITDEDIAAVREAVEARKEPSVQIGPDASEAEYERYFSLLEDADELHGQIAPTRDMTEWTAPDDGLPIGLLFTGDWHCGAGGVLYKRLRADLETIRDTDGLYGILMGDYTENVTPQSKAGTALYSGLFNEPGLQQRYAVQRARIAAGKVLAVAQGNHDAWSYKWAGIQRTDELARQIGAAYFGEGGGTIFATVGGVRYVVAVRHNTSGNSRLNTSNAQRRMFDDFPNWENCDVICVAHFHFNDLQVASRKGGRCIYLRSGTYKVRDEYSRAHGFSSEYGTPLVVLYPKTRRAIPFRGDDIETGMRFLARERGAA